MGPRSSPKVYRNRGCFRYLCTPVRSADLGPHKNLGGPVFIMAHWARKSNSFCHRRHSRHRLRGRHRQAAGNHAIKTKPIQPAARRWKREPIGSRMGMESTVRV